MTRIFERGARVVVPYGPGAGGEGTVLRNTTRAGEPAVLVDVDGTQRCFEAASLKLAPERGYRIPSAAPDSAGFVGDHRPLAERQADPRTPKGGQ